MIGLVLSYCVPVLLSLPSSRQITKVLPIHILFFLIVDTIQCLSRLVSLFSSAHMKI